MKRLIVLIASIVALVTFVAGQGTVVAEYPPADGVSPGAPGDWTYGIYGGIGYQASLGHLHDNFGNSIIFDIGLTGGFRNLRLKGDIAYGQPSLRNNNIFNVPDSAGFYMQGNSNAGATHLIASFQLGYTVFKNDRLAVTPNVGVQYNGYKWDVENYSWRKTEGDEIYRRFIKSAERKSLNNWNWMASVDIDFKLHSHVTQQPLLGGATYERFTSWIRLTPWLSRAAFNKCDPTVSGCNLGITVAYLGLGRTIK